jgi:hypothetical protein
MNKTTQIMGKPMESDAYNNNASNNYSIEDIHDSSNDVVNITKQEEGSKVIGNDNTTDSTYTSSWVCIANVYISNFHTKRNNILL